MTDLASVATDSNDLAEPLLLNQPTEEVAATNNQQQQTPESSRGEFREGRTPPTMSRSFKAAVTVAVMPMFLFGYSTGVMNAPEAVIFPSHTMSQWAVAVSSFCVGGIVGANVSGSLADRFGRRTCLLVLAGYLNAIAGIAHVLAPNMLVLIAARVIVGIAGGASTVLTPMYLGEIAPKEIRGSTGTMTQLSCVLGIMGSILMALPFCTNEEWRFIFVPIPTIAVVFLLTGQYLLPESPRWLLLNHYAARGQEARTTIRRFRNYSDVHDENEDIEMEVGLSLRTVPREGPASPPPAAADDDSPTDAFEESDENWRSDEADTNHNASAEPRSFCSFVLDPKNRIALVSSILFPVAQQLSGINAVFYYSTSFFDGIIKNPQTGTIIAFFVNVVATIVAVLLMDRFGRKTLLSWSAGGMFVCCILLTLALLGVLSSAVTVLSVMLYISFFELGLGCIPFFIASEMIEADFLGRVQSISMSANWLSNFAVGMAFPYMDKYLGAFSFVPFAVVLFGTVLYSVFVLPETRGKSLAEVMRELEMRRTGRDHEPVALSPAETEAEFV